MNKRLLALAAISFAATASLAGSASAVTFADYGANNSNANMTFSDTATGVSLTANATTLFDFLTLGAAYHDLSATYVFTATSTDTAIKAGGMDIQPGLGGSFSFTYNGPTTGALKSGANLLSGTFDGASLSGQDFGSAGAAFDSILGGGDVVLTSDVLTLDSNGDEGFSLSLTSVVPGLHVIGGKLQDFTGVSTGSFSADLSGGGGAGGVPEPASWALMLLGFGGVGFASRSSRAARRAALA